MFIAGFILSSLPQDKISNKPPQSINITENIHASKTNNDIANNKNSQKSIFEEKTEELSL
ncbi:MAG TPA: hypothetical protein DDE71_10245 [Tenacibaculum sp.]|nr:hypothetical protein [Tenacibaculum sp.]